jgi:hypothetical protein
MYFVPGNALRAQQRNTSITIAATTLQAHRREPQHLHQLSQFQFIALTI